MPSHQLRPSGYRTLSRPCLAYAVCSAMMSAIVRPNWKDWEPQMLSAPTGAAIAAAGVAIGAYALLRPPRDGGIPTSGMSTLQNVSALMSSDAPARFIAVGRAIRSPLFRISVPDPVQSSYIVQDGALARAILFEPTVDKPSLYHAFDGTTCGVHSIFTKRAHENHKHARKGVMPAFRAAHLARMRQVCLDHLAAWEAAELQPAIAAQRPIDICAHMLRITVGAISEAAFEYTLSAKEAEAFLADLELCLVEFARKQIMLPCRAWVAWALPSARAAHAAAARNMALAQRMLDHYRVLPAEATKPESVISLIARNENYRSDRERCADLLIMLIAYAGRARERRGDPERTKLTPAHLVRHLASLPCCSGHDTTAFTICWTLCELAQHPQETARLRAALRASPEPHACPELAAVLRESMRLNPVAALGSSRQVLRDYPVPGTPYIIPAGSEVVLAFQLIHRNAERIAQPDEFRPERWAEPSPELGDAFLPFALGARNCVGQGLAMAELTAVVAKLVATYEFGLAVPPEPFYALTNKPRGAMLLVTRASA